RDPHPLLLACCWPAAGLLLAPPRALSSQAVRGWYRDRWPVAPAPLGTKPLRGATRQFVHAPDTGQRRPDLPLLAGAVLPAATATGPAVPTGSWARVPQRPPGRRRRGLRHTFSPSVAALPPRLPNQAAATAQLP